MSAMDVSEKPKTTRITTASARIAAEAKAASAPKTASNTTRTIKRKINTKKNSGENVRDDPTQADKPEPPKTRGRPKKTEATSEETAPKIIKPKTRQTRAKVAGDANAVEEQLKTRSTRVRAAKGDMVTKQNKSEQPIAESASNPTRRITRTRAGTMTLEPEQLEPIKAKNTKVTFRDDVSQDKENVLVSQASIGKATLKEAGLKAKPVRRPAQTQANTRTTRAAATTTKSEKPSQPLSPKKVTQVAKSNSSFSSEDELGKSPIKQINKTPIKSTPWKKADSPHVHGKDEQEGSIENQPTNNMAPPLLTSPAKRLPVSPFKDALKQSPKKVPVFSPMKATGNIPDIQSQFKDSMKRSPKRLGLLPANVQAQDSIDLKAPSLSRAALFGSPARRPNSPLKIGSLRVPGKPGAPIPVAITTSAMRQMKSSTLFSATPRKLFGTPLGASRGIGSPIKPSLPEISEPSVPRVNQEPLEQTLTKSIAEIDDDEVMQEPQEEERQSPIKPARFDIQDIFSDTPQPFRAVIAEEDSEDELQSGTPTMKSPIKNVLLTAQGFTPALKGGTALTVTSPENVSRRSNVVTRLSMTPLAVQMSSWLATSPQRDEETDEVQPDGIFLPVGEVLRRNSGKMSRGGTVTPPGTPTFFEEQIATCDTAASPLSASPQAQNQDLHGQIAAAENAELVQLSQESEYGDENAVPQGAPTQQIVGITALDAVKETFVTPAKVFNHRPKVVYTVSKVPLKKAQEDSPSELTVPKKRSKSLSGPLVELKLSEDPLFKDTVQGLGTSNKEIGATIAEILKPVVTPESAGKLGKDSRTPSIDLASLAGSPIKSVRKGADAQILRGAVVHVDVHTTEGADASGIFVELLNSMGARCIKQWNWNPRASLAAGEDPTANGKVGITHVVFKDGGKRTLQKVREAKGLVLCVGVGWVLE